MDLVGKSLVKNQVSSITKTIGLSGEDKEEKAPYDYKKEQEEEDKMARDKAKRDEAQLKKKTERAKERNKMREKYGLKESKTDQELLEGRSQVEAPLPKEPSTASRSKGKDDSNCLVM